MSTEIRNGIADHSFHYAPYQRAGTVSVVIGGKQVQIEFERTRALLAIALATLTLPAKRANFQRMATAARNSGASLEILREISSRLKVITAAASGITAERRSFQCRAEVRAPRGSRVVEFVASTMDKDRHGTRVDPMGLQTDNFRRNPIFAWSHDVYGGYFNTPQLENIIGKIVDWKATPQAFTVSAEFAETPKGEQALSLVRGGFLNATSIGFVPLEVSITLEDGVEVPVIKKADLLEISLCGVPSNPHAIVTGRSRRAPSFAY